MARYPGSQSIAGGWETYGALMRAAGLPGGSNPGHLGGSPTLPAHCCARPAKPFGSVAHDDKRAGDEGDVSVGVAASRVAGFFGLNHS